MSVRALTDDETAHKAIILADKIDNICDGSSNSDAISAILTVLTWHIAEDMPEPEKFIDEMCSNLKTAVAIQQKQDSTEQ